MWAGSVSESYAPFFDEQLVALFAQEVPDHLRSLLSILVTTGMRLDEASLLNLGRGAKKDEGPGVLYFDLTGAIAKNRVSERIVPVHLQLSWVTAGKSGEMFPQFTRDADGKAQAAASKALMRLIRNVIGYPLTAARLRPKQF